MAGFLRKKVKQDAPAKPAVNRTTTTQTSSSAPPLFARFTTNQVPDAPQRAISVSSPMPLPGAARRAGGPAAQNREGRPVARNASRAETRDVEVKSQVLRAHGTPSKVNQVSGNRSNEHVISQIPPRQASLAQTSGRPQARVQDFDKPLPPPSFMPQDSNPSYILPHLPFDNSEQSQVPGTITPNGRADPGRMRGNKPLPDPMESSSYDSAQRSQAVHGLLPDPEAFRPDQRSPAPASPLLPNPYSPASPPSSFPGRAPIVSSSYGQSLASSSRQDFSQPLAPISSFNQGYLPDGQQDLRRQSFSRQSWTPSWAQSDGHANASPNVIPPSGPEQNFGLHANDARMQNLDRTTPHARVRQSIHRSNSSQSINNGIKPDLGAKTSPGASPTPPSSSPAHRKLSKAKPKAQSPPSQSRPPAPIAEEIARPTQQQRASVSPDNFKNYHQRPPNDMGVNVSAFSVQSLNPAYKGVPSPLPQQLSMARPTSPPQPPQGVPGFPPRHFPPQPPPQVISASPPRISSANATRPPVQGKPLIFTAMAAFDQDDTVQVPDRRLPIDRRVVQPSLSVSSSTLPPPPPYQPHPPQNPETFTFPPRKESLQQHALPPSANAVPVVGGSGDGDKRLDNARVSPQPLPVPPKDPSNSAAMGKVKPQQAVLTEQSVKQSPSRSRKPSRSRTPGQSISSAAAHTSNISSSVSDVSHGAGVGYPIQIASDGVGIPLDDPFAKAEGVKLLGPRPSTPTQHSVVKKASKGQLSAKDTHMEEYHSASEGNRSEAHLELSGTSSAVPTITPSPLSSSSEVGDSQIAGVEPEQFPPPIVEPAVEDQKDHLTDFLSDPHLLSPLLAFLSFYDWCMILGLSREIRARVVHRPELREEILEKFLRPVGYSRWTYPEPEPLSLSLQDLNDYMRGVSTPNHEYARIAGLYVHSLSVHPSHRDPALYETVNHLAAAARAYTRVVLRLRSQAEREANVARTKAGGQNASMRGGGSSRAPSPTTSTFSHSNHSYTSHGTHQGPSPLPARPSPPPTNGVTFQSPLFKLRRAPLLRVFVPSPEGDWLSDKSVLECEAECRRAGVQHLLRTGDVVWDIAVGDEGNVGRLVWDGSYLIDLDYTYSRIGDLPKYLPTLAFPPSYFHRVIRTRSSAPNPIAHIDLRPWGEEIALNLQLLQDRVRTETPQGAHHNVVRWVHRSSFVIRPPVRNRPHSQYSNHRSSPIPDSNLFVDPGWYGTVVVETEGTNESLADLQERCGPGVFPPRAAPVRPIPLTDADREAKKVFRVLREKSRPGEIWIRAVSPKERLL